MKIGFLELARQQTPEARAAAQRVLESGWYINGPELAAFEDAFARYCGTAYCAGAGNGTDALELALRAVGVVAGDEVTTVANAGMYSTTAIRAVGATPVLVDVDEQTLLISPERLKDSLGPRVRAIIVTHLYGSMAAVEEILEVARTAGGIPVIEDCAQAHGAARNGRRAGNWGIAGCFSFYPTKNLGACGDAGAVVCSDATIAERLRSLRQYGWKERFRSDYPGGRNSRMDEIQAAILGARLGRLDHWNARRRAIAGCYDEALESHPLLHAVRTGQGEDFTAHLYPVLSTERERLIEFLGSRGIQTQIHYPIPDHRQLSQQGLDFRVGSGGLTVTERACREVLSIPCYPELRDEEVDYIIQSLTEFR